MNPQTSRTMISWMMSCGIGASLPDQSNSCVRKWFNLGQAEGCTDALQATGAGGSTRLLHHSIQRTGCAARLLTVVSGVRVPGMERSHRLMEGRNPLKIETR